MAEDREVTVKVNPSIKFGEFANAFRIVEEVGVDCFLDFMVYSAAEREATVVSRVRVRREFLPAIRQQLNEFLVCFEDTGASSARERPFRKNGETVH